MTTYLTGEASLLFTSKLKTSGQLGVYDQTNNTTIAASFKAFTHREASSELTEDSKRKGVGILTNHSHHKAPGKEMDGARSVSKVTSSINSKRSLSTSGLHDFRGVVQRD